MNQTALKVYSARSPRLFPPQAKRERFRFDYNFSSGETQLLLDSFSSSFSLKVSTEPGNSDVWFQEDKNSTSLTAKRLKHYFKWILFLSLIFFFQTNIYKVLSPAGSLFTGEWEWDSVQCHQRGSCFDQCCSARRSRKSRRTKTENLHLPKMRTAGVWNQYWK